MFRPKYPGYLGRSDPVIVGHISLINSRSDAKAAGYPVNLDIGLKVRSDRAWCDQEVACFRTDNKQLAPRLSTASNGVGHAYNTPDDRYAVVTNYGNNVISIIDVAQKKTVKDLKIGAGRMGHIAFTPDSHWGYVSNAKDGNLYKIDMWKLAVVKMIETGNKPGGAQVLNVWTNIFEELPR